MGRLFSFLGIATDADKQFMSFMLISFVIAVVSLIAFLIPRKNSGQRILTKVHWLTLWIFVAVLFALCPVYCLNGDAVELTLKGALGTIYRSLRVFVLEGDIDEVESVLLSCTPTVARVIGIYVRSLFIISAILTFGNILSLFKNIGGEFRFRRTFFRRHYIMSELNERSIAMAEDIYARYRGNPFKPMIVFAEVFTKNEEDDYELLCRARNIGAVCTKKDVSHVRIGWTKCLCRVEFFLMGLEEAENVEQAINLVKEYKHRKKTSIYVYSSSSMAGHIIDSLDKGSLLINHGLLRSIKKNTTNNITESPWLKKNTSLDGGFYISRIDSIRSLVLDTLCKISAVPELDAEIKRTRKVSVMVIGMGYYGREFIKTAAWFFQMEGYKLEINIFDKDGDASGGGPTQKRLIKECPELFSVNPSSADGDACYDIEFFSGRDCFTSDFDECFAENSRSYERLKRTQLVFVTLGNDDMNINAAIMLRGLFDRVKGNETDIGKCRNELPIINAVVFDDRKASNLDMGATTDELVDYKGEKFNIRFIGSLKERYSYSLLERNKEQERRALAYHLDWITNEKKVRDAYNADEEFRAKLCEHYKGKIEWYDEGFYFKKADGTTDFDGPINTDSIISEIEKYVKYEYFKHSSVAKAVHKEYRVERLMGKNDHSASCICDKCELRRRSEHMRWNAYMRADGWRYGDKRVVRAKYHNDLVTWKELSLKERFKD